MNVKAFAVLVCLFFLIFVIDLVRREKLTFKYAVGWIFLAFLGVLFSAFHDVIFNIAFWLGFELPRNFIFFSLLCFFVLLSLLLTTFLCQQDSRNDIMAQKISILELEVQQLKEKLGLKD